ncbi:MAG: hypothetical protein JG718_14035 [Candidatus Thiothrix moscowensis]|nr:hypothetical protein [Candidatus Thiothrix moscowensis]
MKTRKNSVLLSILALLPLFGCASVQNHPVYSAWQEKAYSAYGMPVPAPGAVPFMSATMPSRSYTERGSSYRLQHGYTGRTLRVSAPVVSAAEQNYIAQHYSLR